MTALEKLNINALATAYVISKADEVFRELYELFRLDWRKRYRKDASYARGDEAEVLAMYDDALWDTLGVWKPDSTGDFELMVNTRIKLRRINLLRGNARRQARYERFEEESNDEAAATKSLDERESPEAKPTEDAGIKKEIDHGRQSVIDHLLHPAKSDTATTVIVAALKDSQFESYGVLAKATGIHHEVVKRRLRAMASRYDANRFGDIRDYMAV